MAWSSLPQLHTRTYVHLLDGDLGEPLTPLTTNGTTNNGRDIAAIVEPLATGEITD